MGTKQQYKSKGFTIIETLIVLAIAATIFLVVFLAVSALDRSSRNTQRKDDAGAVLAAIADYASNNGGNLPLGGTVANQKLTLCNPANCQGTDAQSSAKVVSYTGFGTVLSGDNDIFISVSSTQPTAASATNTMNIYEGAECSNATTIAAANNAASYAILYGIETSSGYSWQCIGS